MMLVIVKFVLNTELFNKLKYSHTHIESNPLMVTLVSFYWLRWYLLGEEDHNSPETFGSMGTIKKKKKPVD
jgi:hypothetical protein